MNIKRLPINRWSLLALLGSLLAIPFLRADETIETLATFTGPNGAYPGNIIQDEHGNFYGTTYTGGKSDKGTIFEVPLNQGLKTLVSFDGSNGENPLSGLVEGPDGNFYGTTHSGGAGGKGTVFSVTPDGKLTTLVAFNGSNGAYPKSGLLLGKDGNFYGTTDTGGAAGDGELFGVTPQGKLTPLITFNGSNGTNPGGLSRGSDGGFYGTTYKGGANGLGTAFKYYPDPLYASTVASGNGAGANGNGLHPQAELPPLGNGDFSGTASGGSKNQHDTVFNNGSNPPPGLPPLNPQGPGYITTPEVLPPPVTFNGPNGINPDSLSRGNEGGINGTTPTTYIGRANGPGARFVRYGPDPQFILLVSFNGDNGSNPQAGLSQLSDGNFYGTTSGGGKNQKGTVFSLTPQGVLTTVHSFDGSDGANPNSGLIQWSDGYFYLERIWENQWIKASTVQWSGVNFCGTTSAGGEHKNGTVFRITSDGSLTTLVSFTGTSGKQLGTIPNSLIPGNDGNLYGTTYYGGKDNKGTVFRLLLQLWPPVSAGENATAFSPQPVISP